MINLLHIFKGTKETFGYKEAKKINPICGTCKYFVKSGQCILVKGAISGANGSCNFWSEGNPRFYLTAKPPLTKQESKYVETPGGPRCGTCVFYEDPKGCHLVKGSIDPKHGICNAWRKT